MMLSQLLNIPENNKEAEPCPCNYGTPLALQLLNAADTKFAVNCSLSTGVCKWSLNHMGTSQSVIILGI